MPHQSTLIPCVCATCGTPFRAKASSVAKGRGRFCSRSCWSQSRKGERNSNWRGGIQNDNGYIAITTAERGRVREHRLVMEAYLGRELLSDEVVHHINGNKKDNRIDNLRLMSQSEHAALHAAGDTWAKEYPCCLRCGRTDRKHKARGLCTTCNAYVNRHPELKIQVKHI